MKILTASGDKRMANARTRHQQQDALREDKPNARIAPQAGAGCLISGCVMSCRRNPRSLVSPRERGVNCRGTGGKRSAVAPLPKSEALLNHQIPVSWLHILRQVGVCSPRSIAPAVEHWRRRLRLPAALLTCNVWRRPIHRLSAITACGCAPRDCGRYSYGCRTAEHRLLPSRPRMTCVCWPNCRPKIKPCSTLSSVALSRISPASGDKTRCRGYHRPAR